jgi:hypothetical protein
MEYPDKSKYTGMYVLMLLLCLLRSTMFMIIIIMYGYGCMYDITGEWKEDKKEGNGTYTYANGDRFCGGWNNNKKHGHGTYVFANSQTSVLLSHRGYIPYIPYIPYITIHLPCCITHSDDAARSMI